MAKIIYQIKKNRRSLYKELHPLYLEALQECAGFLRQYNHRVKVIFQSGYSQKQSRCHGQIHYNTAETVIYIYTWYRRVKTNIETIFHEFWHLWAKLQYPQSDFYWRNEREAERYALAVTKRLLARRG